MISGTEMMFVMVGMVAVMRRTVLDWMGNIGVGAVGKNKKNDTTTVWDFDNYEHTGTAYPKVKSVRVSLSFYT